MSVTSFPVLAVDCLCSFMLLFGCIIICAFIGVCKCLSALLFGADKVIYVVALRNCLISAYRASNSRILYFQLHALVIGAVLIRSCRSADNL